MLNPFKHTYCAIWGLSQIIQGNVALLPSSNDNPGHINKQALEPSMDSTLQDITYFQKTETFIRLNALQQAEVTDCLNTLLPQVQLPLSNFDVLQQLPLVLAASDFVRYTLQRQPKLLTELITAGTLGHSYPNPDHYKQLLSMQCAPAQNETELARALRLQRAREMVRIAWREITGLAHIQESFRDLSAFADAVISVSLAKLETFFNQRYGRIYTSLAQEQRLMVVAVGKLGGSELNFSSDIDLWFCYPEEGYVADNPDLDCETYFTRLARAFIKLLDEKTELGFVFRLDVRLRPFGTSGPLVINLSALTYYLREQGRDWERFAFLKARVLTGDTWAKHQLEQLLQHFVFRRYLDYGMIQALRELSRLFSRHVCAEHIVQDLKRANGGIREIEWLVQVLQLVRGGRAVNLRDNNTIQALLRLQRARLLSPQKTRELTEAYLFYRRVEQALQMRYDEQTYRIPTASREQQQILLCLNLNNDNSLVEQLSAHAKIVSRYFLRFVAVPENKQKAKSPKYSIKVGSDDIFTEEISQALSHIGFTSPHDAWLRLKDIQQSTRYQHLSQIAKERFERLIPNILQALADVLDKDTIFVRILLMLEALLSRSTYLSLLFEQPRVLNKLVWLACQSPWLLEELSHHPELFATLAEKNTADKLKDDSLQQELQLELLGTPKEDTEQYLDKLRHFKHTQTLRLGLHELGAELDCDEVSHQLTQVAEIILQQIFVDVIQYFEKRTLAQVPQRFILIMYGRAGSMEMNYHSDLDLVFLHDEPEQQEISLLSPQKTLSVHEFFARVAQRMIHYLTTRTHAGLLYEVDTRLRPSGRAGLLVSSLSSFAEYQLNQAWLWEQQALIKARVCCGHDKLATKFNRLRHAALAKKRDPRVISHEVAQMAEKLRANHLKNIHDDEFHLRLSRGGMLDIEFLTQYFVLREGREHPSLLEVRSTRAILQELERVGIISSSAAYILINSYHTMQSILHKRFLAGQSRRVSMVDVSAVPVVAVKEILNEYGLALEDTTSARYDSPISDRK